MGRDHSYACEIWGDSFVSLCLMTAVLLVVTKAPVFCVLKTRGVRCGRKRVVRLMQTLGLSALPKKRRKPQSTKSDPNARFAPNLLNRDFTASSPNPKWVTDCTMIPMQEGWLYLAVVLDLYSRRVVGWAMGSMEDEELVTLALRMALARRVNACANLVLPTLW